MDDDDFNSGTLDSAVFEYSDTSDDMREDAYFLPQNSNHTPFSSPPSLLAGNAFSRRPHTPYQHQRQQQQRNDSGESAFREIKRTGSRSSHIMQFADSRKDSFSDSEGIAVDLTGDLFLDSHNEDDDEDDGGDDESEAEAPKAKRSGTHGRSTWIKRVAYAFRSPSGIHDPDRKRLQHTSDNLDPQPKHPSSNGNGDTATALPKPTHNRMPSGSTTEYATALLRYPSQPKSVIADLHVSCYETSPLLAGHKQSSIPNYYSKDDPRQQPAVTNIGSRSTTIATGNGSTDNNAHIRMTAPVTSAAPRFLFSSRRTAVQVAAFFLMDYEAGRPPTLSSQFDSITKEQLRLYRIHFSWSWRMLVNIAVAILFLSHTQDLLMTAM